MKKKDFYEVLGLSKTADEKEIKKAYRRLAKQYHPDTNQGNATAEQKFKEVSEAYDILGNSKKKALYDKYGMLAYEANFDEELLKKQEAYGSSSYRSGSSPFGSGFGGSPFGGGFEGGNGSGGFGNGSYSYSTSDGNGNYREYHFSGNGAENFDDIFGSFFHGGRSPFGGFSSGGGSGSSAHSRNSGNRSGTDSWGNDPFTNYRGQNGEPFANYGRWSSDPREEAPGSYADLTIDFEEAAMGCDKLIQLQGETQKIQVHIPAGIDEGQSIRLKNANRNLMIRIHIQPSVFYKRKGQDVYTTVTIPYTTAVLGGKAIVRTLHGSVECRIAPGTQCGQKIRLRGKGIVNMKNASQMGDEYVTVQIAVPKNLTPNERSAMEALRQAESESGRRAG